MTHSMRLRFATLHQSLHMVKDSVLCIQSKRHKSVLV
ncbi:erythromycin resistance leader peptide [Domibacillus sp. 8LH]